MDAMRAKAIRYYRGESMEAFSKVINVAPSTISAYENEQREISDYVRAKLIRLEAKFPFPDDFSSFYERFKNNT